MAVAGLWRQARQEESSDGEANQIPELNKNQILCAVSTIAETSGHQTWNANASASASANANANANADADADANNIIC